LARRTRPSRRRSACRSQVTCCLGINLPTGRSRSARTSPNHHAK
jgi:hypothetical protein